LRNIFGEFVSFLPILAPYHSLAPIISAFFGAGSPSPPLVVSGRLVGFWMK
jgi:hypothetical protein